MFFHAKIYSQRCPDCGQTWAQQLSPSIRVIRIGKEIFVCKCDKAWETGRVEWSHISRKQRLAYFISSAEIGVMAISIFLSAFIGYFDRFNWSSAVRGAGWGFVFGSVFVAFLWLIKLVLVGISLMRCPADVPGTGSNQAIHPK